MHTLNGIRQNKLKELRNIILGYSSIEGHLCPSAAAGTEHLLEKVHQLLSQPLLQFI